MSNKRNPTKITNAATPIFQQVMQDILIKIARNDLAPDDRLPSVRDLALEYGINPNTVQKAVEKLTEQGYLISHGTIGKRVTQNAQLIEGVRQGLPRNATLQYLENMQRFGLPVQEIPQYIAKIIEENENEQS